MKIRIALTWEDDSGQLVYPPSLYDWEVDEVPMLLTFRPGSLKKLAFLSVGEALQEKEKR